MEIPCQYFASGIGFGSKKNDAINTILSVSHFGEKCSSVQIKITESYGGYTDGSRTIRNNSRKLSVGRQFRYDQCGHGLYNNVCSNFQSALTFLFLGKDI